MNIKKKLTIDFVALLTITVLCLLSCDSNSGRHITSPLKKEAEAIADSLKELGEFQKYISKYQKMGDKDAELAIRMVYGKRLRNKSFFEAAINQHDTCISIAKELRDTVELINALNHQGTNFRRISVMGEASNCHYEALKLCDSFKDDTSYVAKKNITRTLNGLGNVLLSLENYEAAENMFRRALAYETEAKNPTGMAINLANIGSVKEHQNLSDSAFIYYKQSLEYNKIANDSVGICLCYMYLGKIEEKKANINDALTYYHKSYEIGLPTGDAWHWIEPCISIGNLYLEQHELDSAQIYLELSLTTAYSINSIEHLSRLHELFAKYHEKRGNYSQAILDVHICKIYNDSISLEKNQNHIQNLRVEYEANKVRAAEEKLLTEKRIRNLILTSSLIIAVFVLLAFYLFYRVTKLRRKAQEEKEKAAQERQEFYRGVTHQLRTPLTVVLGMTQQLRKFLPEDEPLAKREFDAVNRQCQQLLTLVTEMIEYSKNGKVNPAPIISELNTSDNIDIDIPSSLPTDEEGRYILIAEDDPDVALLITEMLKAEGYNYAWAKDGQEAWEMMHDNMPELLITDIMMPRMDGLELMKNVRNDESINHLPIIVVSARVENEDRLIGFEAGAEVYLGKPFIPNELLIRIRKLLEQRQLLQNKFRVHIVKTATDSPKEQAEVVGTNEAGSIVSESVNTSTDTTNENVNTSKQVDTTDESDIAKESTDKEDSKQDINVHEMSNKERQFLESVDSYIISHLSSTDLSSATLAEALNTTTSTLNRKLKNLTNIDTTHYIRMHRIEKAKDLLANTDLAMMEIQIECGFDTPSYFSRTFKSDVGVTPSEYRKK